MRDLREFIAEDEAAAQSKAEAHFGVPADRLELRILPPDMEIHGLAGRVVVLGALAPPSLELGPVGEFVKGIVERMPLEAACQVIEEAADGGSRITLESVEMSERARRHGGLESALSHLAERAAERLVGEGTRVRVEIRSGGRGERSRGGRDERSSGGRGDRGRGGRPERGRGRGGEGRGGEGRGGEGRGGEGRGGRGRGGEGRGRGGRGRGGRDREEGEPRDERLEAQAREAAGRAQVGGEAVFLSELNSRERWIVHNALKDIDGVSSESVGEGRLKRVKIFRA